MDNHQGRLRTILRKESTALSDLYGLLMKELVALKERDADLIGELSKEKNTLLNQLSEFDKERQLCSNDEIEKESSNYSNDIEKLSSEIQVCLDKCKKQNDINGGIIEMSRLFNEKMLDIICGNFDKQMTYGETGKNDKGNNQHSLARV